jgi:hypothetical protein
MTSAVRKLLPQIRLSTILLIFFCAAVGMTCATAPPAVTDPDLKSLGYYLPQLNLHYAMLYAASMAMVIGLMQQINSLLRADLRIANGGNGVRFAKSFAIGWRITIAAMILVCMASRILISRRMMQLPEHNDFFGNEIFPDTLAMICTIFVLSDSVHSWRHDKPVGKNHGWITIGATIAGLVFALIVLPDTAMIIYLVHIATQGIEFSHPVRFQRLGLFPDHAAEGYRFFWLSVGAVLCVALAAIALALANVSRLGRNFKIAFVVLYLGLLAGAGAFCGWYYISEFPRISPDLASVGSGSNWFDFLGGAILAAMMITAGAHRFASLGGSRTAITFHQENERIPLHETTICLLLLVGSMVAYFVENARASWQITLFGTRTVTEFLSSVLRYSSNYIMLAIVVLSLQLCWLRWKRSASDIRWELQSIDQRRFGLNWLGLALLVGIGLPTVSIYCFAFWLGPWYLYGP